MKLKNLIKKLFEENANGDQDVFIELFEYTDDGYKSVKIPISSVEIQDDEPIWLNPKPISSVRTLVLTGMIEKAFFNKWKKSKWKAGNFDGELENHFPIKKKVKLTLPKETEK